MASKKAVRKAAQAKAASNDKRDAPAPLPVSVKASELKMPEGYKLKAQVTVPVLVLRADKETGALPPARIITFNEAIHESTYRDPDPAKAKEKPADIAGVTDVETGEVVQFIVPAVVKSQLERSYPDEGYVGKTFRIACLGKRPGKRYWDFSIFEVERE